MQPQSVSQSVSQELRVALWLLHVRCRLDQIPGTYQHNAKALMSLRNTSMLLFWACLFDEMNMNIFSLMENGCEIDGAEISSKFPIRTPLACPHISSIDGSDKTPSWFLELTSQTNTSQTCYRQRSHRSALFLLSTLGFSCRGGLGRCSTIPKATPAPFRGQATEKKPLNRIPSKPHAGELIRWIRNAWCLELLSIRYKCS